MVLAGEGEDRHVGSRFICLWPRGACVLVLAPLRRDGLGEELIEMYFSFREIKVLNLRAWWQLAFNHGTVERRGMIPANGWVG